MKTTELLEGLEDVTLYQAGNAKIKRLRDIITPEVYAKAYDLMIGLAAKGMSTKDMDLLAAQLQDKVMSKDEVEFQLKLIAKAAPANTSDLAIKDSKDGGKHVVGRLPDMLWFANAGDKTPPNREKQYFNASYKKGKWYLEASDGLIYWKTTKYETPEELLVGLTKLAANRAKTLAKTEAKNAEIMKS
jgi:hypothetical protein